MNDDSVIEQADALYDAIGTRVFREEFRELYVMCAALRAAGGVR